MLRRDMLGTSAAGLAALGVGLIATPAPAQDPKHEAHDHEHGHGDHAGGDDHGRVMDACAAACGHAVAHCAEEAGKSDNPGAAAAHTHALRLAIDCQAICALTSGFAARHSPVASHAHAACAEVCRECAEACEKVAAGSEIMKDCAEACRACEAHCREVKDHKAITH